MLEITATEARDRYADFLAHDAIQQGVWHKTAEDGRQIACALGAIGPNVNSPRDCPASVMPRWLAQMVPWLFDNQRQVDALDWGTRFYEQIARLNGVVPFSVVHDWQGNVVGNLAVDAAGKRGRDAAPHEALRNMHKAALSGQTFTADEWRPVLKTAYASASASAYAEAYAEADADAYAEAYAEASAEASADADADAYAYAYAEAYAEASADAVKRLADGLVDCLARVPSADQREGADEGGGRL